MTSIPIHGNYHGYVITPSYTSFLTKFSSLLDITRSGHFCRTNVSLYFLLACSKEREYSMLDATKVGWPAKLVRPVPPSQISRTNSRGVLAQMHGARFVVGVDIDEALIQAAWRRRRAVWSTQAPRLDKFEDMEDGGRPAAQVVELGDQTTTALRHYFPTSCEHEFGSLPIPPSSSRSKKLSFPHNLSFRTADWTKTELPEDLEGYNVVIAWVVPVALLGRVLFDSTSSAEVSRSPNGYISTKEIKALRLFFDEYTTSWSQVAALCWNHSPGNLMRRLGGWTL